MTDSFGLHEKTIRQIRDVFANYTQIEKAILYGSRAKGNFKDGSDIDLTLCGEADLNLGILYKIMDELDELLLPYTIDLSLLTQINDSEVIEHIRRVGVIFYKKKRKACRTSRSGYCNGIADFEPITGGYISHEPLRFCAICPGCRSSGQGSEAA